MFKDVPLPMPPCIRNDRKVRQLEEYTGWFESSGRTPLEKPYQCQGALNGDVFIHKHSGNMWQMWMRNDVGGWEVINRGHRHPYLLGYRLAMTNGKPGWVTRKTISTYNYRINAGLM
jgi:hypothetical protein